MKTSLNTIIQIALVNSLLFSSLAKARELVVSTAASGNTYDVMIQQLANSCNPQMNNQIVNRSSTGSMENIDRLLHNEVAAAIVQTDVLRYRDTRDDLKRIKVLFPLHPEEVHILALTETIKFGGIPAIGSFPGIWGSPFNTLADLKGRKVGAWGGGFVTAQHIRRATEIEFKIVEFSDETAALKGLSDKSVDALISVAGSPQPWIQRLDRKFRLIPIADAELARLKGEYGTARLSYGNLGQTGVLTVATDAVLVVQDYRTAEYSAMLAQARNCFRNRLSELQETPGNASSWHRVDLDAKVNWPLYVEPAKTNATMSRSIHSR